MKSKAIQFINNEGCLLVFPHQNRPEPKSLWSCLYPRSKMLWDWDEAGDNRVAKLWRLREELSTSGQVVYTKWHQNRATLMSREVFTQMLCVLNSSVELGFYGTQNLPAKSDEIIESLQSDSPQSTKQIKAGVELQGRYLESEYNRAMKVLWNRLLIVAWGEFEDSSFPSLGIGSTQNMFEELWSEAEKMSSSVALQKLEKKLGVNSPWIRHLQKLRRT